MKKKRCLCSVAAASGLALMFSAATALAQQPMPPQPKPDTPPPVPPILQNYKPVTAERLKQPEDGDWLMYRRTYDSWGYSPLSQITPDNAARLKPVWTLQTGQIEGHQAPPIVNNGVMFVATPGNQVWRSTPRPATCCGASNGRSQKTSCCSIRRAAASRCSATRCILPPPTQCLWRSTPRPATRCGTPRSRTTGTGITCRWRRSSPTAR